MITGSMLYKNYQLFVNIKHFTHLFFYQKNAVEIYYSLKSRGNALFDE